MNRKTLLLIALLASVALSAQAANLVANPGFETGSFPPWILSGDTSFCSVSTTLPHSGSFSAQLGPTSSNGFLDQSIATMIGQVYTVDFWLSNNDTGANNSFSASFGGVNILSLTNAPAFDYTHYTMDIMATSTSSNMHFEFFNPPAYWFIDDVGVNAVPEPGTVGLIALGGLGLLGAARKRRNRLS